eukprot:805958-Pleurochrysis_carterae.AAC.1
MAEEECAHEAATQRRELDSADDALVAAGRAGAAALRATLSDTVGAVEVAHVLREARVMRSAVGVQPSVGARNTLAAQAMQAAVDEAQWRGRGPPPAEQRSCSPTGRSIPPCETQPTAPATAVCESRTAKIFRLFIKEKEAEERARRADADAAL